MTALTDFNGTYVLDTAHTEIRGSPGTSWRR